MEGRGIRGGFWLVVQDGMACWNAASSNLSSLRDCYVRRALLDG